METDVRTHYDWLVAEENDPVRDPPALKAYMDKWDGETFLNALELSPEKDVLELGVGTGRLALRVAPRCGSFTGVDFSARSVERARENLAAHPNARIVRADFMDSDFDFGAAFDVIYASLVFLHIREKRAALEKIASWLKPEGRFVLSIDKNPSEWLDMGTRRVRLYPDSPQAIRVGLRAVGLSMVWEAETEFAHLFAVVPAANAYGNSAESP